MRDQSGGPRRSRPGAFQLLGTFQLLGPSSRIAQVWRRVVQSVGAALALCTGLTRFGRHGEAAWGGQEDTGGTRAAFRAGGRQLAFRHWPQLCERPALLAIYSYVGIDHLPSLVGFRKPFSEADRATTGHAAAVPSPTMNSRRHIDHASGTLSRPRLQGNGLRRGIDFMSRTLNAFTGRLEPP
jgi:hypothetical protein